MRQPHDVHSLPSKGSRCLVSAFGWPVGTGSEELSFATWEAHADELQSLPHDIQLAAIARRREYLAGRWCARRALAMLGHVDEKLLGRGHDRLPVWPKGYLGSISHSRAGAVAIVAPSHACAAIGVDIEPWMDHATADEVSRQIATKAEWALLDAYPDVIARTLLFCAKETLFKALYPDMRRFMEFDAARLTHVSASELTLTLTCHWGEQWRRGMTFRIAVLTSDEQVFSGLYIPRANVMTSFCG